jgi:signal transduction histidine kinase
VRRRLVLLSLATTVLVVVSLLVPLGLLVKEQAANRAIVDAENEAQSVAGLVALAAAVGNAPVADVVGLLPDGTVVVLADGSMMGDATEGQGDLVDQAAETGSTVAGYVPGGWEIALPVVGTNGVAVVDSFVTDETLGQGVVGAWALLTTLGLVLIGVAVLVADRIGRGLVGPIEDLADSAHRLAEGDLSTRVEPTEPEEIREVGEAFNHMASRLDGLLQEERESAADLSHRLRTPLTSLRLQAESLTGESERRSMIAQVDRMERAMDRVIELARSREGRGAECDINLVVARRVEFWKVLADEQARRLSVDLTDDLGNVNRSEEDVEAVVDILIDNVFSHTDKGTGFGVASGRNSDGVWLEVWDEGIGFGSADRLGRGVSGAGSTGLGLDIVRKIAGSVDANDRPGGGAVVRATFSDQ